MSALPKTIKIAIPRIQIANVAVGTSARIVFRFMEETPGYIDEYTELYRLEKEAFVVTASGRNNRIFDINNLFKILKLLPSLLKL